MGLTTQYLRYAPSSVFGIVGTSRIISFFTKYNRVNKYVVTAACEKIIIWDMKTGLKVRHKPLI